VARHGSRLHIPGGELRTSTRALCFSVDPWCPAQLLGRVFSTLRAQNPALAGEKKKYTMVPPSVLRDGSKKTVFANIVEICKRMHRQPDHVIQYLFSELGTEGSVDGAQRLVIKGRFQPKQIEHVLRRYISESQSAERRPRAASATDERSL
jgi:hypothetical protein